MCDVELITDMLNITIPGNNYLIKVESNISKYSCYLDAPNFEINGKMIGGENLSFVKLVDYRKKEISMTKILSNSNHKSGS